MKNLPNNALKLIHDYGRRRCKCHKCIYLNRVLSNHKDELYRNRVKTNLFFLEFYSFPKEDELKRHFKLSQNKYWVLEGLFYGMDDGKPDIIDRIRRHYHNKNVDKVLKEFNEVLKFIFENNYTKFEDVKLNYYPEIK